MRGFGKRKRAPVPTGGTTYRNPLDAVPLVAPGVSIRAGDGPDSDGLILRRLLDTAATRRGRLLGWLHMQRSAHVKLDRPGSFFWRQIDGQRDLAHIARALAQEFKMADDDARRATVTFTRDLMLRHFIMIRIEAPPASPAPRPKS